MAGTESEKKDGKLAAGLMAFAFIPYWLGMLGDSFVRMYAAAFLHTDSAAAVKVLHSASSFGPGTVFLIAYIWARPAILYKKRPSPELRETVRRRFGRIHLHAAALLVISALPSFILLAMFRRNYYGEFMLEAFSISLAAQLAVLPTIIDWIRSRNGALMEMLYDTDELHSLRPGFSVPLGWKVTLLIASCALLPFALAAAAFRFGNAPQAWSTAFSSLMLMCSFTLLVGLGVVFYGVQRPLNGLISRMRGLASGDFTKTRIYFQDEVARLKAGFNEMADGLKEREELRDTFGKYMSIEIARELIKNRRVSLGGETIEAAVMFCDIRNFTPLSERLSAAEVVEFLNNYFRYITPGISLNNGVINKFIGDAVMAVFTPRLGSSDYAADAVRCAAAMRRDLAEFNASGKTPVKVDFGIGIHAGKVVAGNIGTFSRLEYTFIGDTVNVASRLQSKAKDFGTDIVVSAAAAEKARGSLGGSVAFEPLGKAQLKGRTGTLELYKLS